MNKPRETVAGSGRALGGGDALNIPVQLNLFNLEYAVEFFQRIIGDPANAYWIARWAAETPDAVNSILRRQPDDVLASFGAWASMFQRAAVAELRRRGK